MMTGMLDIDERPPLASPAFFPSERLLQRTAPQAPGLPAPNPRQQAPLDCTLDQSLLQESMALITFLVEDNATIRENLIPALADLADAPVVGVAETEAQAVQWLKEHGDLWHLAVVDLFLREGSGLGVIKHACAHRRPHQRVVVLTNYTQPDIRKRCLDFGADAVFDKSNELDAFLDYCAQDRPSQMSPLL